MQKARKLQPQDAHKVGYHCVLRLTRQALCHCWSQMKAQSPLSFSNTKVWLWVSDWPIIHRPLTMQSPWLAKVFSYLHFRRQPRQTVLCGTRSHRDTQCKNFPKPLRVWVSKIWKYVSAPTPVPVLHKQEQTAPYKSLLLIINQFTLTLQKIVPRHQ